MTTKFISLATGIVLLDVYLRSQLFSSDPLFLFASNSIAVNIGLMILVALMVAVSFKDKFRHWWSFLGAASLAVILGFIGISGVFFSDSIYSFSQILLPMDYLFLMQAAVVFGICALSYEHEPLPATFRWPQPMALLNNLALSVPKALHSPSTTRSSGASPA